MYYNVIKICHKTTSFAEINLHTNYCIKFIISLLYYTKL